MSCQALWAGLVLLAACAPRNAGSSAAENTESRQAPVITLERTSCFGICPVYRLSVKTEGRVSYQGKAHVRHMGEASGRISPDQVEALLSEIDQAGYFSFADRYTANDSACGRYATDSPSAVVSVQLQGRTKRIEHDHGCSSAPSALGILERRIDEVLGSGQWTGR